MRRLLSTVLVLLVLLAVGDRVAAFLAARVLAGQLQAVAGLAQRPEVDVRGVPFLTQAVSGRYEQVEVRAVRVPVGRLTFAELDATVSGARVPLRDLLDRSVTSVPTRTVEGRGLLSYQSLSRSSGDRNLTVTAAGDRVRVTGSVQVLGRTVSAAAVSAVTVDGDDLVVRAQSFEVGNAAVDAVLSRALGGRLDLRLPIGDLPYGLKLESVAVDPDGVSFRALARDVVLEAP